MSQTIPAPQPVASFPPITPTIAILNQSTILTDAQVQTAIAAAQIQIIRDLAPAWFVRANLRFMPHGTVVPPNAWVMQILDTSDQKGAAGYHSMSNAGQPSGSVFAKTDADHGLSWTVTLTHELVEMIGDPYAASTVFAQTGATTGMLFASELCDAVEDDALGYLINGVRVTDFVLPAFFEAGRAPGRAKFDFCGHLTAPFSIAPGGYLSVFPVESGTKGWTQQFGPGGAGRRFKAKQAMGES